MVEGTTNEVRPVENHSAAVSIMDQIDFHNKTWKPTFIISLTIVGVSLRVIKAHVLCYHLLRWVFDNCFIRKEYFKRIIK